MTTFLHSSDIVLNLYYKYIYTNIHKKYTALYNDTNCTRSVEYRLSFTMFVGGLQTMGNFLFSSILKINIGLFLRLKGII